MFDDMTWRAIADRPCSTDGTPPRWADVGPGAQPAPGVRHVTPRAFQLFAALDEPGRVHYAVVPNASAPHTPQMQAYWQGFTLVPSLWASNF